MNAVFCALDKNKFNCIYLCKTTHKIRHTLEVTHEGMNRVKESIINLLMNDFEVFRMKPSEIFVDMYTWFTDIINSLKVLSKSFFNFELLNKILQYLLKNWDLKVMTI